MALPRNTGRFANEKLHQRPVGQRMKSVRQRGMSVCQRLYASHFRTQCPKYFFVWLGSGERTRNKLYGAWMKERGISCMALSSGYTY